MKKLIISTLAAAALVCGNAYASEFRSMSSTRAAGSTTVQNSYKGVDLTRNLSIGAGTTTIYSQPGRGGDGPVMGTQRGSSSNTSYGAMIEYRFR